MKSALEKVGLSPYLRRWWSDAAKADEHRQWMNLIEQLSGAQCMAQALGLYTKRSVADKAAEELDYLGELAMVRAKMTYETREK